jgi:hypothetical protein
MTTTQLMEIIRKRHPSPEWAFFEEFRPATGWLADSGIDAWAINLWPSRGFPCVAYELKVSRSDWLRELKDPTKREQGVKWSSEFWIATLPGVVKADEVPEECGLLVVAESIASYKTEIVRPAPVRSKPEPTWAFVAALARRVHRATTEADWKRRVSQARADGHAKAWAQAELYYQRLLKQAGLDPDLSAASAASEREVSS